MTDLGAIGWDGWSLGDTDKNADQLRIVTGSDEQGAPVVGFGVGRSLGEPAPRIAGGIHLGRALPGGRTIVVPVIQTRSRSKARKFAQTMGATQAVRPLEIHGLLWADDTNPDAEEAARKVVLFARPDGVDLPLTALGMGGPSVLHLRDATWIAPDPTIYDAEPTLYAQATATNFATFTWTNQGDSTPPPGLGGHAWTIEVTAATTVRRPWIQVGSRRVAFRNVTLAPGQKLTIGPDRITRIGTAFAVGTSGNPPSRSPQWPILEAGVERLFRIGCESGTFTAAGQFRSTW